MLIPLTLLVPVNSYLALYLQIYVNIFQIFGQCCVPWLSGEKGCLSILSVEVSAGPGSIPSEFLMLIQQGEFMEPVLDTLCLLSKGGSTCSKTCRTHLQVDLLKSTQMALYTLGCFATHQTLFSEF